MQMQLVKARVKARSVEQKKGVPVGAGTPRPVNNACYYANGANGNGQVNTNSRQFECQDKTNKAVRRAIKYALQGQRHLNPITDPQDDQSRRIGEAALCLLAGQLRDVPAEEEWETVTRLFKLSEDEQNCLSCALTCHWKPTSYSVLDIFQDQTIPTKIDWIIPYFLPRGGIIDVFGGPESGKTTFLLGLLFASATGADFYPFQFDKEYKIYIIGGEKNSLASWKRSIIFALQSLDNVDTTKLDNIKILDTFSSPEKIQNKHLLKLSEKEKEWEETETWRKMITEIEEFRPDIILFDTLSACFLGYTPNLWSEHQKLILKLSVLAKQYNLTILTVSHTNQQSKFEPLTRRLDYTARSGNNGIPGELRCILGFTHLHPREVRALEMQQQGKYIACCVAKANDFMPKNNVLNPLLFHISEGKIQFISEVDAEQVEELARKNKTSSNNKGSQGNRKNQQKEETTIIDDKNANAWQWQK